MWKIIWQVVFLANSLLRNNTRRSLPASCSVDLGCCNRVVEYAILLFSFFKYRIRAESGLCFFISCQCEVIFSLCYYFLCEFLLCFLNLLGFRSRSVIVSVVLFIYSGLRSARSAIRTFFGKFINFFISK